MDPLFVYTEDAERRREVATLRISDGQRHPFLSSQCDTIIAEVHPMLLKHPGRNVADALVERRLTTYEACDLRDG